MFVVLNTYTYGYFGVIRFDRKQLVKDLVWVCTFTSNLQPAFQKTAYWQQLTEYRFFVHTWSLGVELQYYLFVPMIMWIASYLRHTIRLIFFLCLAATSLAFQLCNSQNVSYGFPLSRLWQFICGSIVYESTMSASSISHEYELLLNQCYEKQDSGKSDHLSEGRCHSEKGNLVRAADQVFTTQQWLSALLTNVLLIALLTLVILSPENFETNTVRVFATCMAGALIYLNANVFLLTNTCIVYCGDISYVLYLVHWPVIVALKYCLDPWATSVMGNLTALIVSFTISVIIHHTLEDYFIQKGILPALICVVACYACIFFTIDVYVYAPPLENINPNISKIEYAIEWNMRELRGPAYRIRACDEDDTLVYAKFQGGIQWRCLVVILTNNSIVPGVLTKTIYVSNIHECDEAQVKGYGTASIMLVGNSFAHRAFPLIHDILRGHYSRLRLFSRSGCSAMTSRCSSFLEALKKVVQHEKPDILLNIHQNLIGTEPIQDLKTDFTYEQYQSTVNFMSNYTKHIVIDMPSYKKFNFVTAAVLARKLQLGLTIGDEFIVTWQQYIEQVRYKRMRMNSLKCAKCIMNDISEGLFQDGIFLQYDPNTFLARVADGWHLTRVGLELLRPLYTRILEKLLQELES